MPNSEYEEVANTTYDQTQKDNGEASDIGHQELTKIDGDFSKSITQANLAFRLSFTVKVRSGLQSGGTNTC